MNRPEVLCDPVIAPDADATEQILQAQRDAEATFARETTTPTPAPALKSIAKERERLADESFYRSYGERHSVACA